MVKKSRKTTKKSKKSKKKIYNIVITIIILVIIISIGYLFTKTGHEEKTEPTIVAIINGEEILAQELDNLYSTSVPDIYRNIVDKKTFLNQTLIPQKLLMQEAEKKNIITTEQEVDEFTNQLLETNNITIDEFESQLTTNGISLEEFKKGYKTRLTLIKLLNSTVFSDLKVNEKEIETFYEKSELKERNITLNGVEEQIKQQILFEKQQKAFEIYILQLRKKADIKIFLGEEESILVEKEEVTSFKTTKDQICRENGKPIIRLFSTTDCPRCKWINNKFNEVMEKFKDKIIAYHWNLDTGDNALTKEIEKGIPKSELEIFKKYNSESTVPTFIFGCKYIRVGIYYDDTNAEEREFTAVIEKLL